MTPSISNLPILPGPANGAALAGIAHLENQSALRERISGIAATVIEAALGEALRALVLTGSLARDEAGFDIRDGLCRVRGDSEFLVVLKDRAQHIPPQQRRLIMDLLQAQLLRDGIDCHVSVGFVKAQYLVNIRPHVFGYELSACGLVVIGEPDILSLIPRFSPHEIPLEDGWQLLVNRIVEFIGYAHEWIAGPEAVSAEARYRMVKLYLDMATSFLLFESAYEPTYLRRAEKLKLMSLASDKTLSYPFSLQDFSQIIQLCTRFKVGHNLNPEDEMQTLMDRLGNRDSLTTAVTHARSLWRWELAKLSGTNGLLDDRQLMHRWMKLQPLSRRLPGWGYVLRHSGWYRSWKHWPAWASTAWKASPRYWVYLAACELFFSLPILNTDSSGTPTRSVDFQRMRSCLVVKRKDSKKQPVPLQEICSEIVSNYREFLEGTRA